MKIVISLKNTKFNNNSKINSKLEKKSTDE